MVGVHKGCLNVVLGAWTMSITHPMQHLVSFVVKFFYSRLTDESVKSC